MAAILGTLRVGGIAGLITNSATGEQMAAMIADTGARHLFLDSAAAASLEGQTVTASDRIAMDGSDIGTPLDDWMAPEGTTPEPVAIRSEEHTSELQSLMRISYAVLCLHKKIEENNKQE